MSLRLELEELEKKFRETAMRKYGYSKGSLKKASMEAFRVWINEQKEIPISDTPFDLIEGMLQKFRGKVSSVELQHSAKRLWVR